MSLQCQHRQFQGISEDYITNAAMAEGLDIMYYPVNTAALDFPGDITDSSEYGVRIGVITVLAGE